MTCLSFVFAILAAEPKSGAEWMPQAPKDWRSEHIDFPLSFAPEIKYKGFEELRFAPGMFSPTSDTYFTYVFGMSISEDVKFDAKSLQSLLETYFRGLCQAVGKEKKFDIDGTKISAQVHADSSSTPPGRSFRATVASFDPFVTGKPLTLNLEITVFDSNPTDHRIFAVISPQHLDSPIWKQLHELIGQFKDACAKSKK